MSRNKTQEIAKLTVNKGVFFSFLFPFQLFMLFNPFTMFGMFKNPKEKN
jgi:hypothetical protein